MNRTCALNTRQAYICLPARVDQVARAREFVLTTLGAEHPEIGVLQLIVDELVTNSILHSRSGQRPGGNVSVTLTTHSEQVRVEVTDDGAATLPRLREAGSCSESGRGLHLVDALATSWNCFRDSSGATVTWAEVTG